MPSRHPPRPPPPKSRCSHRCTGAAVAAPAVAAPAPGPAASRPGGRVKASPLARRIARERGVDLASVVGTGPDGRIVAEDVERAGTGAAPAAAGAVAAR